jgi:hypothetical protein
MQLGSWPMERFRNRCGHNRPATTVCAHPGKHLPRLSSEPRPAPWGERAGVLLCPGSALQTAASELPRAAARSPAASTKQPHTIRAGDAVGRGGSPEPVRLARPSNACASASASAAAKVCRAGFPDDRGNMSIVASRPAAVPLRAKGGPARSGVAPRFVGLDSTRGSIFRNTTRGNRAQLVEQTIRRH